MSASGSEITEVAGFEVALDRAYDPAGHLWVSMIGPDRARIGLDALGVETSGTIAQLAFLPTGEHLKRGEAFGSLEAAKFVGPLASPLTGTVTATNDAVVADPALVERDPYGAGWLYKVHGNPEPNSVDVQGYTEILDLTIDKMQEKAGPPPDEPEPKEGCE